MRVGERRRATKRPRDCKGLETVAGATASATSTRALLGCVATHGKRRGGAAPPACGGRTATARQSEPPGRHRWPHMARKENGARDYHSRQRASTPLVSGVHDVSGAANAHALVVSTVLNAESRPIEANAERTQCHCNCSSYCMLVRHSVNNGGANGAGVRVGGR